MKQPLLSICIPTYGRVNILKNTLDSIFSQNVDLGLFEVCITDNSPTNETSDMLQSLYADKTNLHYQKVNCEGYYNSIAALKLGHGKFLKLHNNYTMFKKSSLIEIINMIKKNETIKPVLFFTFGNIKQEKNYEEYNSFDTFLNAISYFSTWSTSFGIWNEDFDVLLGKKIELDNMFPHTSLLFALTDKNEYIVDNTKYFENQDVGTKGGYNLPETFGTRYIKMCKLLADQNDISVETLNKIKENILLFIAEWYLKTKFFSEKYTFSYQGWEKTIFDLYGNAGIEFVKQYYKNKRIKYMLKKMLKRY